LSGVASIGACLTPRALVGFPIESSAQAQIVLECSDSWGVSLSTQPKVQNLSSFVWLIAEILRGDFKRSEYGRIILPFVVLRRLDCILEPTKDAVLQAVETLPEGVDEATQDMILYGAAGTNVRVYNKSRFTFATLRGQDPGQLHENLIQYITNFSANARDIFLDKFLFTDQLKRLNDSGILWQVFDRFCQIDLHPDHVSNVEMGYLFEDLIRRFSEISNETAGEHFTPREVIRLIVDLLLANDHDALAGTGIIRRAYDPAAGTGGMLTIAEESIKALNSTTRVELFGQELNPESFAICKSDMLVTGHDPEQIAFGNSLTEDAHGDKTFHYMLSNPPYGVDWKKYQDPIKAEHAERGFDGRFGAGLPRVSDGQLLFLQHMIAKMRDDAAGSRIGIVMNGSPLFTGGAGSGESEIRRWMLENDWVEAIVALPTDLFYNTGIQTYVWLLTNRKQPERAGKVQVIDASGERFWRSMRKSLGAKRREIPDNARDEIVRIYSEMLNGEGEWSEFSKIFDTTDFGYREIRVERPLKLNFQASPERIDRLDTERAFQKLDEDEQEAIRSSLGSMPGDLYRNRDEFDAELIGALNGAGIQAGAPLRKAILNALSERDDEADVCVDSKVNPEPDSELRDYELVPLGERWQDYVEREVTPFVPDAWVDTSYTDARDGEVGRVGYEINFNRYFYQYVPPRPLEEIDAELKELEAEIAGLLKEVAS
jgi:type I restriction enzyme M protein